MEQVTSNEMIRASGTQGGPCRRTCLIKDLDCCTGVPRTGHNKILTKKVKLLHAKKKKKKRATDVTYFEGVENWNATGKNVHLCRNVQNRSRLLANFKMI